MRAEKSVLLTQPPGPMPGPEAAAGVRDAADLARLLARFDCKGDIIVASNRAPWIHRRTEHGIVGERPAGGLVTALEAVLAAQGGCWIAHGSGSGDRATAGSDGHVAQQHLPSGYRLRRLWLSAQEVAGYYDGMANEALWPLCHDAGVTPVCRAADWACYRSVNQRFADAIVAEARSTRPVVLVQDYHLALVPQMVRALLPHAVIISFWHIPFPAPQALARFPWRGALMQGLLGSTVVGVQTAADLARFAQARAAERVQGGAMARAYPVSIAWPGDAVAGRTAADQLRRRFGIAPGVRLLLGVDRMDYIKGIAERLRAFGLYLERHPEQAGKVALLQIAAPGRMALAPYRRLDRLVRALANRINRRFGSAGHQPVVLHTGGLDAAAVAACYRACQVCLVTSLQDGMNLVAKEFVAARADLGGVLVLSRFAGAADELVHGIGVDPRDIPALAAAIAQALAMPPAEQARRMAAMRAVVRTHTVFRWAAQLLQDGLEAAGCPLAPAPAPARAPAVAA